MTFIWFILHAGFHRHWNGQTAWLWLSRRLVNATAIEVMQRAINGNKINVNEVDSSERGKESLVASLHCGIASFIKKKLRFNCVFVHILNSKLNECDLRTNDLNCEWTKLISYYRFRFQVQSIWFSNRCSVSCSWALFLLLSNCGFSNSSEVDWAQKSWKTADWTERFLNNWILSSAHTNTIITVINVVYRWTAPDLYSALCCCCCFFLSLSLFMIESSVPVLFQLWFCSMVCGNK